MKSCAILIMCSFYLSVAAQQKPHPVFINGGLGFFRVTSDQAELNNKPFMIDAKVGIHLSEKDAVGFMFSSARQTEPTAHRSNIQPAGGGNWQMFGTIRHQATAIGLFYDRFFGAGKKLIFFPSAYAQYFHYVDSEIGYIVAGTDTSIATYENRILHNYKAKFGLNLNLQYKVSPTFSITAKFAQIDCRVWNTDEQNVFFELPLILGVKYLFK